MEGMLHYLDDYLLVGTPGTGQCAWLLQEFVLLDEQLGVPLAQAPSREGKSYPGFYLLGI